MWPIGQGVAAALAAASLYSLAVVLQKREAERVDASGLAILGPLVRRPAWLFAIALQALGLALQSFALTRAPMTVVEPVLAGGLAFVVLFALLVLRERPGRREILGTSMLAVGIALLVSLFETPPVLAIVSGHDLGLATTAALALTAALVASARESLVPYGRTALLLGAAAGVDQGMSDAMNRLAGAWWVPHPGWVPTAAMGWLATGLLVFFGVVGLVITQNALRRYRANAVVPCIVAAQVVVPIAVAATLFGERMPNAPLAMTVATVLTCAGLAALSTSPTIAATLAGSVAPAGDADRRGRAG